MSINRDNPGRSRMPVLEGEPLNLLKRLLNWHQHQWGVPHRNRDGVLIQTCYYCTTDRRVKWDIE